MWAKKKKRITDHDFHRHYKWAENNNAIDTKFSNRIELLQRKTVSVEYVFLHLSKLFC